MLLTAGLILHLQHALPVTASGRQTHGAHGAKKSLAIIMAQIHHARQQFLELQKIAIGRQAAHITGASKQTAGLIQGQILILALTIH